MIDTVESLPANDEFENESSTVNSSDNTPTSDENQTLSHQLETENNLDLPNQDRTMETGEGVSSSTLEPPDQLETQANDRVGPSAPTGSHIRQRPPGT